MGRSRLIRAPILFLKDRETRCLGLRAASNSVLSMFISVHRYRLSTDDRAGIIWNYWKRV